MSTPVNRIKACTVAAWSRRRDAAGTTTVGWQDKRAHIARWSGVCFCLGFCPVAHIFRLCRNVCQQPKPLSLRDFVDIAGLRHGR